MSFFGENQNLLTKKKNIITASLRTNSMVICPNSIYKLNFFQKRMSLFTSSHEKRKQFHKRIHNKRVYKRKGSLTVEASVVLPFILFFMMYIMSFFHAMWIHANISQALQQCMQEMAVEAHMYKKIGVETDDIITSFFSAAYIKKEVTAYVGKENLAYAGIVGSDKGLHISHNIGAQKEVIDVVVTYQIKPILTVFPFSDIQMINRCAVRAWTGYDNTRALSDLEYTQEYVYITKTGVVYHRDRNCTYLKLSIKSVSADDVEEKRNESGGKYHACEICGKRNNGNILYITDYGDRYHTSIGCSGLKRTIMSVPISEVGDRRACSKCGG